MSEVLREEALAGERRLQIVLGDLTDERVDAIVNAANSRLNHGGGVAGVISRRGGPRIQLESDEWVRQHGPVSHAEPAYTTAGNLPARYVIHAVGPVWDEAAPEEADRLLAQAVSGSLSRAGELKLQSIALPAISTGIFGFPLERAAGLIVRTIRAFFDQHPDSPLDLVRITLIDRPTAGAFLQAISEH